MGMNDDQLSAAEHDAMRSRLLAGTKRIKPAGAHRRAIVTTTVAVAIVAGLSAGAVGAASFLRAGERIEPISTPTPSTSATPTPLSTPETTATPIETGEPLPAAGPVVPFDGACGNALSDADVTAAYGERMEYQPYRWTSGAFELSGGITCTWTAPDEYAGATLRMDAFPNETVPDDVRSPGFDVVCGYPTKDNCGTSGVVGTTWVSLWGSLADEARVGQLWEELLARAAQYPPAQRAEAGTGWWTLPTCDELDERVDVGATTSTVSALEPRPSLGEYASVPGVVPARLGVTVGCAWTLTEIIEGQEQSRLLTVTVIPGGGPYAAETVQSAGAVPVEVPGAVAARVPSNDLLEGHTSPLVVTDGVNFLDVTPDPLDERTDLVALARAFLDALAS